MVAVAAALVSRCRDRHLAGDDQPGILLRLRLLEREDDLPLSLVLAEVRREGVEHSLGGLYQGAHARGQRHRAIVRLERAAGDDRSALTGRAVGEQRLGACGRHYQAAELAGTDRLVRPAVEDVPTVLVGDDRRDAAQLDRFRERRRRDQVVDLEAAPVVVVAHEPDGLGAPDDQQLI